MRLPGGHRPERWGPMGAWDVKILGDDVNEEFLDELNDLDDEEVVEAVRDACVLAGSEEASEEE